MERFQSTVGKYPERENYKEYNDCTVVAWAECFDSSYENAHAWLKKHGRINRRGMYNKELTSALKACKKAKVKFGPYSNQNRISLSKFLQKHPKGRYYVCSRGHAYCVKDGVVYDYKEGLRRQVIFAARVYLEGEI
jgi:hypothetical protein